MSGVLLDNETTAAIDAAGAQFIETLKGLIGDAMPVGNEALFTASVGVQSIVRALADPEDDDWTAAAIFGAGEGVGTIVGLVGDAMVRQQIWAGTLRAVQNGAVSQARIHESKGNA